MQRAGKPQPEHALSEYASVLGDISGLLEQARRTVSRSVNAVMTATYWEIGRRIVTEEQRGRRRAGYGEALLSSLSADLTTRFGRGFSVTNLVLMRQFYTTFGPLDQAVALQSEPPRIHQTASDESDITPPRGGTKAVAAGVPDQDPTFPLTWSHYVRLMQVKNPHARRFYESEALRGGWTVRQLDRQIDAQFYERTALSKNKRAMLTRSGVSTAGDVTTPEQAIKDPFVLEFLNLKDEYSETDLEDALIHQLETFLLELGGDFTFVGRQRRLRIGNTWYRVDLLFFHRRLKCLVIIDLKLGRFTHADAGQMHLYLNYAREHWMLPAENPPVGLILCAEKDHAVAHYSLEGLPNTVLAAEYRTTLPDEQALAEEIARTRAALAQQSSTQSRKSRAR